MKLSYKYFKEQLDFDGSAQDLARVLADLGFPNDGVTHQGEGLDQVVVGKVLTKNKHPQADRLNLLTVDVGSEQLPIVCGAQNMVVGDFVALAPIGAKIPGKDGSGLVMKEAKIRGETSKGMCCSEVELRLSDESDGILLLPKDKANDSTLGKKVSDILNLQDWILDIDVTPNRGDALSYRGLAREVSAKTGVKLKSLATLKWKNPTSGINPTIENLKDASGFAACLVQGVNSKPTPEFWQNFLQKSGARSISNLVDVTNIVLFELGHPIHFFDADKVDPATIQVRRAKAGESVKLLNDQTIKLDPEDLVIADSSGVLSLAGIMGGAESSVSSTTRNILIEAACFNPVLIRATAKRHGLSSESSHRFERGLTPFRLDEVIERAIGLLKELSGFETAAGTKVIDRHLEKKSILYERAKVEAKLGKLAPTDEEIFEMLRRLDYEIQPKGSTAVLGFPWYRTDMSHLEDVMEDIARLLGYENLAKVPLKSFESVSTLKDLSPMHSLSDKILNEFISIGFSEAIHMSFADEKWEKKLGLTTGESVALQNPIHSEKSHLRRTLAGGLLERAQLNANHSEDEIRLVEVGPVFKKTGASLYDESPVSEEFRVGCVWLVQAQDKKRLWSNKADAFYEFKGAIQSVLGQVSLERAETLPTSLFHPNRILNFTSGIAGELHPRLMKLLDLSGRCFIGEWTLQGAERKFKYEQPPQFPSIDLDVSFLVPKTLSVQEMLDCFKKSSSQILEWVRPYDLYESKDLGTQKKSMTFAMRYRDPAKTLTMEEAKQAHDKIVEAAMKTFAKDQIALR
ncbi:MAG: phenylalanine--tRNA ligase subunit beta [Deltaproteobacteria bacterium]|nr:phenylalanine--tRNA ligase subunit beta [Deltaproteobacteria bacterium]